MTPTPWLITRRQLLAGRRLAGLGVRQLADLAKMSPTALSHIETGHTRQPQRPTLEALALALIARDIQFAPGGWVRHAADQAHPGADFMRAAPMPRMERARLLHHVRCVQRILSTESAT